VSNVMGGTGNCGPADRAVMTSRNYNRLNIPEDTCAQSLNN